MNSYLNTLAENTAKRFYQRNPYKLDTKARDCKNYLLRESKEDDYNYSDEDILYQLIREMRTNYKLELRACMDCVNFQGRAFTGHAGEPLRCKKFKRPIRITDAVSCNEYEIRQRRF